MSDQPEPPATRLPGIVNYMLVGVFHYAPLINMPQLFRNLISARLMRLRARLYHLLARGPVPIRPRPARVNQHPTLTTPNPEIPAKPTPEYYLPTHFGWLVRLFPRSQVTTSRQQLQTLLDEPEAQALITGYPTLARSLRPLCHMLGLKPPTCLKLPRRPRAKPARKKSAAPRKPKTPRKSWSLPPPPPPMTPAMAQLAARQFFNPRDFLP